MYPQLHKLFAPPDAPAIGGDPKPEETYELLSEELEETLELPKTPSKEKEDDKEPEDSGDKEVDDSKGDDKEEPKDEIAELEEELEKETKPDDEDAELDAAIIVSRREILKKYPNLYRDFPQLEKAFYRERQFSELLPTIKSAKEAVEKARILDSVENEVMSGDITSVLAAAKQESPEAFLKIADNYLPTLKKVDQQAYYHVMGNVVKDTIITMVKEARALGDQGAPLQAAANILNQFVFGSQTFQPPTPLSRQPKPEENQQQQEIQNRERQRVYQQFESVRGDLQTRADNVLKASIDKYIDPNKSMTDFVRTHASNDAFKTIEGLIEKDTRFRSILDKLWERAFQRQFDRESTDKIKSAYLSKAKTLLPSVIRKARNDALRGMGRRVKEEAEEQTEETPANRSSQRTSGNSTSQSGGRIRKPGDIPRGMTTLDVLMKD